MNCQKVADAISAWLADKVEAANADGVVIGLSGGIDSTVVAAIAGNTPGLQVTGVIMPCDSVRSDKEDAYLCAAGWCSEVIEQDLTAAHAILSQLFSADEALADEEGNEFSEVELAQARLLPIANMKSRLRMLFLYYIANRENLLVCGTTNKSELLLGYLTKYGDGGVDIEPIIELWKTEVFELARHLPISQSLITKMPSAGLWPGQTDAEDLGMTYRELDPLLRQLQEVIDGTEDADSYGEVRKQLKGVTDEQVGQLATRMLAAQHKQALPPGCRLEGIK